MKKEILPFIIILLLSSNFLIAQERYIDILVSDTLEIEAEEIIIDLTISSTSRYRTPKIKDENGFLTNEYLEDMIEISNDIEAIFIENPSRSINLILPNTKATLKVKGKDSLDEFLKDLDKYCNVQVSFVQLKNSQINSHFELLTKRLLVKAKQEGLQLASVMNSQNIEAVEIVNFKETTISDNISDSQLQSSIESLENSQDLFTKIILSKGIRVKFKVK